jgi:hypothetical protein
MNREQRFSQAIKDLKDKVHNAGDHASPWNVYDSEDVDEFIKKVSEILKIKEAS